MDGPCFFLSDCCPDAREAFGRLLYYIYYYYYSSSFLQPALALSRGFIFRSSRPILLQLKLLLLLLLLSFPNCQWTPRKEYERFFFSNFFFFFFWKEREKKGSSNCSIAFSHKKKKKILDDFPGFCFLLHFFFFFVEETTTTIHNDDFFFFFFSYNFYPSFKVTDKNYRKESHRATRLEFFFNFISIPPS